MGFGRVALYPTRCVRQAVALICQMANVKQIGKPGGVVAHIACVGLARHRPHLQAVRLRAIQIIVRRRGCEELHGSERICSLPGGGPTKAGDFVHTALAVSVLYKHGRRIIGNARGAVHHGACVAVATRVQPCVDRVAHTDGITRAVLDAACLELEQL
eukprot:scaffold94610_cov72-Phaeocystis_antarctica.AAC.1